MGDPAAQIPDEMRRIYEPIVALTDAFCDVHLDEEYKRFSREMAALMCQRDSPMAKGKPASWASGIVHALGWVNFLNDPATKPYMTSPDVAKGFGVSQGTMSAKSKIIREALSLIPLDPNWCLSSMVEDNPLVWLFEVDGVLMDIRKAPREIQEQAFRVGAIPYVPADRESEPLPDGVIARIGTNSLPE